MPRDSVGQTFKVAFLLCIACSVLVSAAAVGLRSQQQVNQERERKSNILSAAGFGEGVSGSEVESVYSKRVVERIVDLDTGEFTSDVTPSEFNQRRSARDPELSDVIPTEEDLARVRRREQFSFVYMIKDDSGEVDQIVLPIRGYGLWSTL